MNFGEALEQLKAGKRVAREGWNGRGIYIYLVNGYLVPDNLWQTKTPAQDLTPDEIEKGVAKVCSHIDMRAADGSRVIGWLASQTDMLSDDWVVVGEDGS